MATERSRARFGAAFLITADAPASATETAHGRAFPDPPPSPLRRFALAELRAHTAYVALREGQACFSVVGPHSRPPLFWADWDGTEMEQRGRSRWQTFGPLEPRNGVN
jgi:hypothetical protein